MTQALLQPQTGQDDEPLLAIPPSLQLHIDWLREAVLPFWMERAADNDGLFFEALHLDGSPDPDRQLRLRTGMRQIHVFAEAAYLGLANFGQSVALAATIARKLREIAWRRNGRPGWASRFLRDGTVTDPRLDLCDHALAVLGLGTLSKVLKSEEIEGWLAETISVIDSLGSEFGGWDEDNCCTIPRRQSPHMHLFDASLTRIEAFGRGDDGARARQIFRLFRERFFSDGGNHLTEYFGPRWEIGRGYESHRFVPGHMAEWIDLLRKYSRLSDATVERYCTALLQRMLQITGRGMKFLPDEIDAAGRPLLNRRRLWPQTEFLTALIVEARFGNSDTLIQLADKFCGRLHETYLTGTPRGTWCDRFDLIGRPVANRIPAGTLYRLVRVGRAILEYQRHSATQFGTPRAVATSRANSGSR